MANYEKFKALKALIDGLSQDSEKFYERGNSAAGTRMRKGLQEVKNLAQELRISVQELKNKK